MLPLLFLKFNHENLGPDWTSKFLVYNIESEKQLNPRTYRGEVGGGGGGVGLCQPPKVFLLDDKT